MANLPADLRKLLEWLERVSPLLEAQIVAAGMNHTLALSKFPVVRPRTSPGISDNFLRCSQAIRNARAIT
jgi:hypothetical protein